MPVDSFAKFGAGGRLKSRTFSNFPAALVIFLVAFFLGSVTVHLLGVTGGSSSTTHSSTAEKCEAPNQSLRAAGEPACDKIEDFIEDGDYDNATIVGNAWRQMKWVLPAAKCRVKGHLIERLDPTFNWRRGVALRFTEDPDDKNHLEHWFYGTKVDLNQRKRRVYIDLGANYFHGSVVWMNVHYPVDFTEVYAFEADSSLFSFPTGWVEENNWVAKGTPGFAKIKGREGHLPDWMINRVKFFNKFVGVEDSVAGNSVNITRFIKDELRLTAEDAVIVKMDIEGSEWPILRAWAEDPDLPEIIDELLVEVHYYHPPDNNWVEVEKFTRDEATRILAELRFKGWYVHYWN